MLKIFYVDNIVEDKDSITLEKNEDVDKICINVDDYTELYNNKCNIDYNINTWEKNKKRKNKYELVYVSNRNSYYNVADYIPISRSYFKLWEILTDINFKDLVKEPIQTSHLAEGPGGFIEATINYCNYNNIKIKDINAITLREDNNDVPNWNIDSLLKNNNIKIHYGKDLTGNIYNIDNILDYVIKVGKNSVTLVTADGGLDYSKDYNKQEQLTYRLLLSEITIALSVQTIGGFFIFKLFDISTRFTLELLYILYRVYSKLIFIKPYTSRSANSEKYVICQDFKGICTKDLNKLYEIINNYDKIYPFSMIEPKKEFINKLREYNSLYTTYQIKNIQNTLDKSTHNEFLIQITKAKEWCIKYNIPINYKNKYFKLI